jgi:hypothetical protein
MNMPWTKQGKWGHHYKEVAADSGLFDSLRLVFFFALSVIWILGFIGEQPPLTGKRFYGEQDRKEVELGGHYAEQCGHVPIRTEVLN